MPNPNPPTQATIVHGDYRLGNTMFALDAPARLTAVLDWEMATIGDPLADIGYLCMMWAERGDPEEGLRAALGNVTRAEGFNTREELIARYEQRSGRSVGDIRWYVTLALWKSVVFMEGNYKRAIAGTTDDPYLRQFGDGVLELAGRAEEVALSGGASQSTHNGDRRTALLIDWGGVLTSDLFASFHAYCLRCGLPRRSSFGASAPTPPRASCWSRWRRASSMSTRSSCSSRRSSASSPTG